MKSSDDWEDFYRRLDRALPKYKPMPLFDKLERAVGPISDTAAEEALVVDSTLVDVPQEPASPDTVAP